jgi:hypothetical protein
MGSARIALQQDDGYERLKNGARVGGPALFVGSIDLGRVPLKSAAPFPGLGQPA